MNVPNALSAILQQERSKYRIGYGESDKRREDENEFILSHIEFIKLVFAIE